jgi:pimeloyl-ACP methyl ester carboxylesterase
MEFTRPFNPVASNAQELKTAIDRITAATGHKEIDIVSHSMGGLDTRAYLDQNAQEKVGKLVMIGTPNHGSVLADLELVFREHGIAIKPQSDDADIRQALKDLTEVRGDNNPTLNHLNANLERQRARADMLVIAGNGRPTLSKRTIITLRGDGVVAQHSTKLPGVAHRNIWWTDHSGVKEHPDALRLTGAFLAGRALPAEQQEPPDIPPDREVAPEEILADQERVHYILNQ